MKVGDKIEILKDGAACTGESKGTILTVIEVNIGGGWFYTDVSANSPAKRWMFDISDEGEHYKVVETKEEKVAPPVKGEVVGITIDSGNLLKYVELHDYLSGYGYKLKIVKKGE